MKFKTRRFTDSESFAPALAGFQQKGTVMQKHRTNSSGGHSTHARRHQPTFNLSKMLHCAALVICLWFSSSAFAQISAYMIIIGPNNICGDDANTNLAIIIDGNPVPYVLTYTDGVTNYAVNNYYSGSPIYVEPSSNTTYTLVSLNDIPVTSNNGAVSVTVQQPIAYYLDADGDGYGNPGSVTYACIAPAGYVANNRDCDDSNTSFARVNTVTATITGNTSFCAGASTLLNANASVTPFFDVYISSYQWKRNNSNISGANNATYTATTAGSYTVVATTNYGCSVTSESVTVTVKQPTSFTETISACVSYDWHGTTYTASNNTATWIGTNAAGCDSTVTLNLTITNSPTATITGNTSFCAGASTLLNANATSGGEATAITGGDFNFSLFLKNDGTVWATGLNTYGQLGIGTTEFETTPVKVPGLSGITAVAGGQNHSLFLKNDGTVMATGFNIIGELGDGTREQRNTPVQVIGFDVTITSYQWKLNGSDIAGATDAAYTATEAGSYTVVVTNSNGCSVTSESVTVTVNQPTSFTETISACVSYDWHGTTYTASNNTATWIGTNAAGCDSTVTLNLTIQNLSTAPTSITSSVAFALAGTNFTLSVNGGSLGTDATWNWYTDSCGGTLIGTGASISVSQNVNTTYYVRAEGTCNTTDCASITVNSFCGATGITSSAGTTAICAGSPVTLTVIGSLSPGAQWRWDDECDNDDDDHDCSYNTSSTFTVSPNSTKTYYVRSVGGTCGLTACVPITVNVIAKPATPGTISGSASVCPSTSVTYTIAAVAGATSYTWTAPTNATLVSAQGATSMTVAYAGTFTSGTLKVKANNCSGSSSDKSLSVAKQAVPATPCNISGASAPCKGSTQTYSTSAVSGATSYTWTLPTGVSFVSGTPQTGTSIQVVVDSTFSSGTLSVKANNCGGSSSNRTKALTGQSTPTAPGNIDGPNAVTQNSANNTFNVSNVAGMTYNWTVPAGCTITLGQGTSTIKVTWGTVAGTVSVTRNNGCGTSVASTKSVSVKRSEEAETDAGMEGARTEETVETLLTQTDALNAIAVYPNPTTGEARITFNTTAAGKYNLSIVDLQGRAITSTSGAAIEGNNTIDINLSNCSNGVYMIHLMHNDTLQTLRVVKM